MPLGLREMAGAGERAPGRSRGSGRGVDPPGFSSFAACPLIFCQSLPLAKQNQKSKGRKPRDTEVAASGLEQGEQGEECSGPRSGKYSAHNHSCEKQAGETHICICAFLCRLIDARYFWDDMHTKETGRNIWEGDVASFLLCYFTLCVYYSQSIHPPISNKNWHF